MNIRQVKISFEDLNPKLIEIVREIKTTRRVRGLTEIIIGLTFVAEPGPAALPIFFIKKPFTKQIGYLYEQLAKKIEKTALISPKITENFPVLSVNGRGDLIFRKITKKEKLQMKLHIGRHRRILKHSRSNIDYSADFLRKLKIKQTNAEQKFGKLFGRLRRTAKKTR